MLLYEESNYHQTVTLSMLKKMAAISRHPWLFPHLMEKLTGRSPIFLNQLLR